MRGGESSIKRWVCVACFPLSLFIGRRKESMKNKSSLNAIFILLGLVAATFVSFALGRFALPAPAPTFSTAFSDTDFPTPFSASELNITDTLQARIRAFDLSPDLKTIAFATSKGIVLWDLDHKNVRVLNKTENFFNVELSINGEKLAACSISIRAEESGIPHVVVWNAKTFETVLESEGEQVISIPSGAMAWSPNGHFLSVSLPDRGLVALEVETGKIASQLNDFLLPPYDIAWSPDGSRLVATGDLGYGFRRWRMDNGETVRLYDPRAAAFAVELVWSPSGDRIASIHADGVVCFWTVSTNRCDGFIKAHHNGAFSLAWSSDGNLLATGGG